MDNELGDIILRVQNLQLGFQQRGHVVAALQNVSFDLKKGEILGIVGESGSGKSVTSLSIMGLLNTPPAIYNNGEIIYGEGLIDLMTLSEKELSKIRGKEISMIFQEPMTSLNPSHRCGNQVAEAISIHQDLSEEETRTKVIDLFAKVLLPDPQRIYRSYPHQLSGGQIQRVMIAMAMANRPSILIADEPTTALDVTVQKQILHLIKELQKESATSTIFISHDLGVIRTIADRVIVMQKGIIVEQGLVDQVFNNPQHPYTKGLIACRPPITHRVKRLPTVQELLAIPETEHEAFLKSHIESKEEYLIKIAGIEKQQIALEVSNLSKKFPKTKNWLGRNISYTEALRNVELKVYKGEICGLVGESGCGKSTLGNCILRLHEPDTGEIIFEKVNLLELDNVQMRKTRKKIQMIFQDPYSSLNPRMTIGEAIKEPMVVHQIGNSNRERKERVYHLLNEVGLENEHYDRYPHQFSGGQRQRIGIARTLSVEPEFIICDESVSALDVSVQAQVLNLLAELREKYHLTMIFISHDLSVIKHISDHIAVMEAGRIVEYGDAESVFSSPQSPYTVKLLNALPQIANF